MQDLDTSWCPVCDRQILPKRWLVPVKPQPPAVGGLAHGTGRLRQTNKPKMRTVIDQGPTPLYCSDECRLADLNSSAASPLQHTAIVAAPSLPVRTYSNSDDSSSESSRSSNASSSRERGVQRGSDDSLTSFYGFRSSPASMTRGDHHLRLNRDGSSRSLRQNSTSRPRCIATAAPAASTTTTASSPPAASYELRFARSPAATASSPALYSSPSSTASSPKRPSALQKAALDGKLLLPESTKRRESSAAADAAASRAQSIKSRSNSTASLAMMQASAAKLAESETRSWSYDNLHTYAVMPPRAKKEKQTVLVDGKMREVEVDVFPEPKRLFLFPGPSARHC